MLVFATNAIFLGWLSYRRNLLDDAAFKAIQLQVRRESLKDAEEAIRSRMAPQTMQPTSAE